MPYQVVFLDWYKTLSDSLFWEDWAKDDDHKATLASIQSFLFVDKPTLFQDWMRGKYTAEEVVQQISEATSIAHSDIFDELVNSSKNMHFKDVNVVQAIQNLRNRGTEVLIATDNMDTFGRWTAPALHLNNIFDGILDSHTLRALKEDYIGDESAFFGAYLQNSPYKPSQMLLIDDRKEAAAVQRTGMNFMHYDGTKPLSEILDSLA